jgi:hypothetical protein
MGELSALSQRTLVFMATAQHSEENCLPHPGDAPVTHEERNTFVSTHTKSTSHAKTSLSHRVTPTRAVQFSPHKYAGRFENSFHSRFIWLSWQIGMVGLSFLDGSEVGASAPIWQRSEEEQPYIQILKRMCAVLE